MDWINIKEQYPHYDGRVLVYSPLYDEKDPMRYRIMNTDFVRLCSDATHWMPLDPPERTRQ